MRSAVFDLDGTLADTSADLITAANACFDRPMLDPLRDAHTAFRGGRAMLRLGLERLGPAWDEADVDTRFPRLLEYYGENIDTHTRLYPGAERVLDRLSESGWKLGVCTNKPEGLADTLLTRLGIRDRFAAMLGADTLPVRKPDARHLLETIARMGGTPDRAALVGDTETDRAAARNAGVPCILVTFGPDGEGVADLLPEATLPHYDDLPDLLERMIA